MKILKKELKSFLVIGLVFVASYFLPVGTPRFDNAVIESLHLVKYYATEHVILCLIPAFFIAGAVGVFVSKGAIMKYLGADANKFIAYSVASVSGCILAVCSCTILPLFSGIYKMGAGLGPACAFLYSGPAINILAILLTARVLGFEMGVARAVGAILFSIIIGLLMHLIFLKEEREKAAAQMHLPETETKRTLWQNALYFGSMTAILVFANWGEPETHEGLWFVIYSWRWVITSAFSIIFGIILTLWFELDTWKVLLTAFVVVTLGVLFSDNPEIAFIAGLAGLSIFTLTHEGELAEWFESSWGFAKQIFPLLLFGVVIAGLLLGRAGHEGLIPSEWVAAAVGGNCVSANFFASLAGAFMYFATLTEVPILEGLIGSGMGRGPALALLLAGPALSLPNMLVIRSVLGTKKTVVFVILVVVMATISGIIFGAIS